MATQHVTDTALSKIEELYAANKAAQTTPEAQTGVLDAATQAAYRERQLAGQQAQSDFARNVAGSQMSALDAIRRSNASAIASGANAGLGAANQLSAILGLQEETAAPATELANDAIAAAAERNTQLAQNAVTGLEQSNLINQQLREGNLGLTSLFPELAAAEAEDAKAQASVVAAELGLEASNYTADTQKLIAELNAKLDWDKTKLQGALTAWDLLQEEKGDVIKSQQKILDDKKASAAAKEQARKSIRNVELEQLYLRQYLASGDEEYLNLYESVTGAKASKDAKEGA